MPGIPLGLKPYLRLLALLAPLVIVGCPKGWFGSADRPPSVEYNADYLPKPAVLGQPITVVGYYLDGPSRASASIPLSTTSVRIQLAPITGNSNFRIELGTVPLIDGRFTWTDVMREKYGGVTLKASESYELFADFGYQVSPTGVPYAKAELPMYFTVVATP